MSCTDPTSGLAGYCAGEHLLMSATPTVYQNSTSHQLKGMVFGYTTGQQDTYTDLSQTVGGQPYQVTTTWQYLNSYRDTNTGVGAKISYYVAYNNTHGTPLRRTAAGISSMTATTRSTASTIKATPPWAVTATGRTRTTVPGANRW